MKKLGTKGPLLLHYYNGELRVLFELLALFRRRGILINWIVKRIQEEKIKRETSF
jgi:hypothetical protein